MPVTGLPATLEKALTALLTDNAVSSWKVAGEGDSTVVVLRLKPAGNPMSINMADPVLNRNTQVQYYRKKPPCQIRRDQERARQQQLRQASAKQNEECPTSVNVQYFPEARLDESSARNTEAELEHTRATHLNQSDSGLDQVSSYALYVQDNTEGVCINPTPQQQSDTDIEPVIESSVRGFSTSVVQNYVATLTDKRVQRRLRDKGRNKSFRKVAIHPSNETDVLICESDDLVLEFSCMSDSVDSNCVYWFVKQEDRNMLSEERAKLVNLRRGERVNGTQYADIQARAARDMEILHGLIQFYLG